MERGRQSVIQRKDSFLLEKEKKAEESVGMEREAKEEKCGVKGRRRGGGREKN